MEILRSSSFVLIFFLGQVAFAHEDGSTGIYNKCMRMCRRIHPAPCQQEQVTELCIRGNILPGCKPCVANSYFSDVGNPTQYYECIYGLLQRKRCIRATVWHQYTRSCIFKFLSKEQGVKETNIKHPEVKPTHQVAVAYAVLEFPVQLASHSDIDVASMCVSEVENDDCQPCQDGTFYAKPGFHTDYYECDNGVLFTSICPEGTEWGVHSKRCIPLFSDDRPNSHVQGPQSGIDVSSMCVSDVDDDNCQPCQDGMYYAKPGFPTDYYECDNGMLFTTACPDGTEWGVNSKQCIPIPEETDLEEHIVTFEQTTSKLRSTNATKTPTVSGTTTIESQQQTVTNTYVTNTTVTTTKIPVQPVSQSTSTKSVSDHIDHNVSTAPVQQVTQSDIDVTSLCESGVDNEECQPCEEGNYYAKAGFPSMFYQCDHGLLVTRPCPKGTVWNEESNGCIAISTKAPVEFRVTTIRSLQPTVTDTHVTNSSVTEATIKAHIVRDLEKVDDELTSFCILGYNNPRCLPCKKDKYYPKSGSLSKFYQCSYGWLFLMECPAHTVWNGISNKCIQSHSLGRYEQINTQNTSLCVFGIHNRKCHHCQKGKNYPKLGSVFEFFYCSHGVLFHMHCPAKTMWDEQTSKCTHFNEDQSENTDTLILTVEQSSLESVSKNKSLAEAGMTQSPELNSDFNMLCKSGVHNPDCHLCQKGSFYTKSGSPSTFYQCIHGLLFTMKCPTQTVWDEKSTKCIHSTKQQHEVSDVVNSPKQSVSTQTESTVWD